MLNRRTGLTAAIALYLALIGGGCASISKIRDDAVRKAALEGKIIADLHTHPSNANNLEALVNVLSSGVVGLAAIDSWDSIFTYEDVLELPKAMAAKCPDLPLVEVREIEPGFAEIRYNGNIGYALRCEEVMANGYHFLGVGIAGNIPKAPENLEPLEELAFYVAQIQQLGGFAVLPHPCLRRTGPLDPVPYRDISAALEEEIKKRMNKVGAAEGHNMMAANVITGIAALDSANDHAQMLAEECGIPAISVSDSHDARCILASGIAISSEGLTKKKLFDYILSGEYALVVNHHTLGTYLSTNGFLIRKEIGKKLWWLTRNTVLLPPRLLQYGLNYVCPSSIEQKQQPINTSSE